MLAIVNELGIFLKLSGICNHGRSYQTTHEFDAFNSLSSQTH